MPNDARTVVVLGAAQIDGDGYQWIEVIPTATEARNGRWFFTITSEDLTTYAQSIEANPGLIPVDYDHTDGTGTVAAGWYTGETDIVAAGGTNRAGETQQHESLWARIRWTPQAAQEIKDGRYKRVSPEFSFVDKDAKTGLLTKAKEIVASTLTNRPFFKQMAPVGAAGDVVWDRTAGFQHIREKLAAALNPGNNNWRYCILDIDVTGARALVEDTQDAETYVIPFTIDDQGDVTPAPSADWVSAEQEWVSAARQAEETHTEGVKPASERSTMKDELKPVAAALGLGDDATDEQVIAAAAEAKEKADKPAPTGGDAVVLSKDEVAVLRADAQQGAAAKKELDDLKVKTLLDTAEKEGQTVPAQREALETQAAENFDAVKAFIDATPKRAVTVEHGSGGDGGNDPDNVTQARGEFEYDNEAGRRVTAVDVDLHVAAEKILADKGKGPGEYTSEEYTRALAQASRAAGVAA